MNDDNEEQKDNHVTTLLVGIPLMVCTFTILYLNPEIMEEVENFVARLLQKIVSPSAFGSMYINLDQVGSA